MKTLEKRFKEFEVLLKRELEDKGKDIEERIEKVACKSYADALGTQGDGSLTINSTIPTNKQMRQIISNVRNEEKEEERERNIRSRNLIVHDVQENENDQGDKDFIGTLLEAIGVNATIKSITRLGKMEGNKVRPIKFVVDSEVQRNLILESMYNIKGADNFKNVRVTRDLTITERNEIRGLVKQAKERNENAPEDCVYEWKVREDAKNGIRLMRFKKRNVDNPTQ